MLVSNEISKNQYVGDGSATEFAYTFPILDSTHIEVYRQLSTETALEAKLVPAEEYTVEGGGVESGGKVVFKTAPSSGTKLSILRNVPITQLYQYQELDSFPAESHENALAKLTMICQSLDERLDRAIVVSPTDIITPDELRNGIFEASEDAIDSAAAAASSESNAASSASNAASSETAAAASASSAAASASNAASSETAAANSETAAAVSASSAAASETAAANSETAAAASASSAATSETAAANSETAAAVSASNAASSETAAANSAAAASASASNAASSETAAANSETAAAASASNAASSASNAASSASAAASSEAAAANSAAAILELEIEVATLNPGQPASGNYDPITGILHLSIPKGDSGDAAIATPTSLGSVMPQTGDGDGLEQGTDGSLRVREATTTQRGSVLASTTAAANTVPQAGANGKLDPSWVPEAFPAGTQMLFVQAAAPTGWTKQTTVNDATIRIVSGTTGGTTGGSVAFSTAFVAGKAITLSGNVGATTLSTAQMPWHTHPFSAVISASGRYMESGNIFNSGNSNTSAAGGSGSHTHSLSGTATVDLSVKYVDTILCQKA